MTGISRQLGSLILLATATLVETFDLAGIAGADDETSVFILGSSPSRSTTDGRSSDHIMAQAPRGFNSTASLRSVSTG